MRKILVIILLVCICSFGNLSLAYSGTNALLYITNIQGESVIQGYEGWIDILSWSWQTSNPNAGTTPGRGYTPAIVRPLIFTKYLDKASPLIAFSILNATQIQQAIFVLRNAGQTFEYLRITMSSLQVANVSPGGSQSDDRMIESVALAPSRICYKYTPQKADGTPDASIEKCWDILKNEPI